MKVRPLGRPPKLNKEAIERAVIEIGFVNISTTQVAKKLGVEQSSLYRHIASREDMLIKAVARVMKEADWTFEHSNWREFLSTGMLRLWSLFEANPGMAGILYKLDSAAPEETSSLTRRIVATLNDYGFTVYDAFMLSETLLDLTCTAYNKAEHAEVRKAEKAATYQRQAVSSLPKKSELQDDDAPANITNETLEALRADRYKWWLDSMNLVLDGAESLLTKQQNASKG